MTNSRPHLYEEEGTWSQAVIDRLTEMNGHLRRAAASAEHPSPGAPRPHAKYPGRTFDYIAELEALNDPELPAPERVLDEVAAFFRGAQRPESPSCLFNLNVLPTVDAAAAACISVLANVNGLMDAFAGESLLVEQKLARTIGRWAGWNNAMGIACTGGKSTMAYALRAAIARVAPDAPRLGVPPNLAVLCSAGAHYSVEHVAAMVGIGSAGVHRVRVDERGAMHSLALREALAAAREVGQTVVAVVCCGGTVIGFSCDDLEEVRAVVTEDATEHDSARPYLHFDSVIGWPHLAAGRRTTTVEEDGDERAPAEARIAEVVRRCKGVDQFDSLGVDFHKTGLCPYASSMFVASDGSFMDALGDGSYVYGRDDLRFGSFRSYRYTHENTRATHGLLSAWVNVIGMGRTGLADYLLRLQRGRSDLEDALRRHGRFTPLNESSLGWEVVFDVPQPLGLQRLTYPEFAIGFMEHCWRRVLDGYGLPLFSVVPEFQPQHDPSESRVAFVLYPMGERRAASWDWVVSTISDELDHFEAVDPGRRTGPWERPIR